MSFLPRPRTCSEQPNSAQNLKDQQNKNQNVKNSSINPITHLRKQQDQQLATKKSIMQTKRLITTKLQVQSSKEIDFQKDLNQNGYTINLSQSQKYSSLPKIRSISNIRQNLVSEEAFEHYKRVNAVNGHYQQALKQLQRVQEQKLYRLKIQNRMKIKTRKNIFQMQKTDTISDIYDLFVLANSKKMTNRHQKQKDPLINHINQIKPQKRKGKTFSKIDGKWKIGDFLEPIINDQNQDYGKVENVKKRLSFLGKIQKITSDCDDIEDQNTTKNYLKLFSKFSEKLSTTLHKKTKKLDKVRIAFRN